MSCIVNRVLEMGRYVKISYPEYAQGDMTWAVSVSEMLNDTLNALLEYLDDGIEVIN